MLEDSIKLTAKCFQCGNDIDIDELSSPEERPDVKVCQDCLERLMLGEEKIRE